MARPSDYNEELAAKICERLIEGESLRAVCRDPEMPSLSSVMLWLTKHSAFSEQYAKATEERAAGMFEDMLDIADEAEEEAACVAKARLRVDTRKWALARMMPKKYGDKLETTVQGPNGGPVQTNTVLGLDPSQFSAEFLKELAEKKVGGS